MRQISRADGPAATPTRPGHGTASAAATWPEVEAAGSFGDFFDAGAEPPSVSVMTTLSAEPRPADQATHLHRFSHSPKDVAQCQAQGAADPSPEQFLGNRGWELSDVDRNVSVVGSTVCAGHERTT